jgi:hypothetical protein
MNSKAYLAAICRIESKLPQNPMQDTIYTDDSPGNTLNSTVGPTMDNEACKAGVDHYSAFRLDTLHMENRNCGSTMGSAFGFESAVHKSQDIGQTMDPEVVQSPDSCSG